MGNPNVMTVKMMNDSTETEQFDRKRETICNLKLTGVIAIDIILISSQGLRTVRPGLNSEFWIEHGLIGQWWHIMLVQLL